MAKQSTKVKRSLARYLTALVARLETDRGQLSTSDHAAVNAAFEDELRKLSTEERAELEHLAASLAATLAVASASGRAQA